MKAILRFKQPGSTPAGRAIIRMKKPVIKKPKNTWYVSDKKPTKLV